MKEHSAREIILMLPALIAYPLPFSMLFLLSPHTGSLALWIKILLYAYLAIYSIGKSLIIYMHTETKNGIINPYLLAILTLTDLTLYLTPLPPYWVILMLSVTSYSVAINIWTCKREEAKINRKKVSQYIKHIITETQKHGIIEIPKEELKRIDTYTPYNLKDFFEQHGTLRDTLTTYYQYTLNDRGRSCARQIDPPSLAQRPLHGDTIMRIHRPHAPYIHPGHQSLPPPRAVRSLSASSHAPTGHSSPRPFGFSRRPPTRPTSAFRSIPRSLRPRSSPESQAQSPVIRPRNAPTPRRRLPPQ